MILLSAILIYRQLDKRYLRVKRWKNSLNLREHARVFQNLYQDVDGYGISRKAREKMDAFAYTYGEIDFLSFIALLSLVKPNENSVFYDLGSGTGKAIIAAAMVYPMKKTCGIELFAELHIRACQQKKILTTYERYQKVAATVEFIQGDYFLIDMNDATVIFINSTALFGEEFENLSNKLNLLPHLQVIITTSKPLLASNFSPFITTKVQMSWGVVTAYIQLRKTKVD
ncbi:MAG TPA: hypothetical protein PK657_07235 [Legionella sp.]|nr:hypothetical protein [Legionella sp.]